MNQRFYSLDVFRGATVALMILVNNPGSWSHIFPPLEHAPWHGVTPTDLVFPFFLFAVGNALSFVMPRLESGGPKAFWVKVIKRSVLIFGIGLFLNWSPFIKWQDGELVFKHWVGPNNPNSGIRILGVLQRIALSYFFASIIIYLFKIRGAIVWAINLLLAYWIFCAVFGTPGDPYSLQGYFGIRVDKAILHVPHMYKGEGIPFDPEGITSTMTSIVQVIFGYFVGYYIRQHQLQENFSDEQRSHVIYKMLTHLFIGACILLITGLAWGMVFPINKKIWTSSYVVYTTGLAIMVLCFMIYLLDVKKLKGDWSRFFDVFGKNALFIFFLSGFLPRVLALFRWVDHVNGEGEKVYTSAFPWFYNHVCKNISTDLRNGSLLYAICMIVFYWSIVYWMDRKKIYIKV